MCFEGLARLSRRVWRRFVRGSREISLVPSLHTSYSITELEEGSKYNITVSAGKLSKTVSAVTIEKGEGNFEFCVIKVFSKLLL